MRKIIFIFLTAVLLGSTASFASCSKDDNAAGQHEQSTFIPQIPQYNDAMMWVTADGDPDGTGADIFYVVSTWEEDCSQIVNGQMVKCHYADVWNATHREHMGTEINKVAAYMSPGNRFFAPFYRHTTSSSSSSSAARSMHPTRVLSTWATSIAVSPGSTASAWRRTSRSAPRSGGNSMNSAD